jgi:ATP-dependent DNA helicase RecQ
LPESPESYYQEAGRAGRDGHPSYAVLLYNRADLSATIERIENAYPDDAFIRRVYQAMGNYLQIPVGAGHMQSFDFDLDRFQTLFNLPGWPLVGALDRLENAGLIARTDSYRTPGRLQILVPFEEVYSYQMQNPASEPLLKAILRSYGGSIYNEPIAISESRLALSLGADAESITRQLQTLAKQQLLSYSLPSEHPQLTLLTERYAQEELPLRAENLDVRRQEDLARAEAMISLTTEPSACRMVRLVGYFGQAMPHVCGICDNCLRAKKAQMALHAAPAQERVLTVVPKGTENTVGAILRALPTTKVEDVLEAIRCLLASNQLILVEDRIRRA